MNSPTMLLSNLLADVRRLDPLAQGLERDFQTLKGRFENEGIGFTVALSRYADHFDQWLAYRRVSTVPGFSRKPRSPLPKLLSGLVANVFDSTTGLLLEEPCLSSVKSIRQILRFFKKALIVEHEKSLHAKEEESFYEKEKSINQELGSVLDKLRHAGYYVLPDIDNDIEEVYNSCRHGPGAVAEKVIGNQKWSSIVEQIEEFDLFPNSSYDLNFVEKEKGLFATANSLPKSRSRFVTVPKSVTSRRGITVEPLMMQFYQQGLNSVLRKHIARCALLSTSLDLTDQSKNQHLALEGSRTGYWSTLDLSSASDLLRHDVVEATFHSKPNFWSMMDQSRSSLSDGSRMKKYAGMGNATTFPVQSIVFTLICAIAITEMRSEKISKESLLRSLRCVRVFGDDIIVPTNTVPYVVPLLQSAGLRVNNTKSFSIGNFRESCGVDAFMGVDVSPIYYRLDPRSSVVDESNVATLVSTSNQLWLEGYYSTSTYIKKLVQDSYGKLPYVPRGSGALGWITRSRVLLKPKYSGTLHRDEIKVPIVSAKSVKNRLSGYPALFKFFLTSLLEREKNHLKRSIQRYSNQVRWRWVPVIPVTSSYLI